MIKPLRIIFMGTPDFAVATLKALVEANYNVVGVITAPDKLAGRGQKLRESAVKTYAKSQGLCILQPTNLKHPNFIEQLKTLQANLQIVVAFRMLPKAVWQMPTLGTFNLHASLLPNYRGAAPINWAIINGETKTGVSTFFIDEKIDTGAIILQKETPINPQDTAGTLHDRLMKLGQNLVLETIQLIAQKRALPKAQTENNTKPIAHKLNKDNCRIDWHKDLIEIHNTIRGLSPYPTAWTVLKNGTTAQNIKIYKSKPLIEPHKWSLGTIISYENRIKVAVKGGYIEILEMTLPGKKNMPIKALLNGYQIASDAYMY